MARSSKAPRLSAADRAKSKNRPKKRSGNPPGSRQHEAELKASGSKRAARDPRIGSRKPIPLVGLATTPAIPADVATARKLLVALEADPRFNQLLDRVDADEQLSVAEQAEFDAFVSRHEQLVEVAGEDWDEEA